MRKRLRLIGIALLTLLMLAVAGFYAWARISTYPAFPQAITLAEKARVERGWYVFEPREQPAAGFIFYPGGLVDPAAYAPLMQRLSDGGVRAVIVPMPLDLAIFGQKRARDVIAAYPEIDTWVIGGHSLGGAMAAEFVKRGTDDIDGIAFLASYSAKSTDLSAMPIKAVSIYGTEDGVAGDVFEESLQRLPRGTATVVIEGGNHAQFGDYGPQEGDGTAAVSRDRQQQLTAEAILRLVESLER